MSLPEILSGVSDRRSAHALRHRSVDVLLMCIIAIMSGYGEYRSTGRFLSRNEKDIRRIFGAYHGVPGHAGTGKILQGIDFERPAAAFNRWASQYVSLCRGDTKAIDGKAIAGTASNFHN